MWVMVITIMMVTMMILSNEHAWEQDFLSKRQFTEEQQHQIRDIRRRGKNKVIKWDKFDKNRVKNTWKNGKTK